MGRKKILLVDDAKTVILMEQMILNRPDLQLITASDGDQAIEVALAEQPDLILLDVVMPTLTGIEVCQRLRSEPSTKATPIIMVTTRGEEQYIDAARAAGCTDYVTKPLDAALLLHKVRSLLSLKDA
jgi:CheY-like chemotaxis protein